MKKELLETFSRIGGLFKRVKIIGGDEGVDFYAFDDTTTIIFHSHLNGDYPDLRGAFGIPDAGFFLNLLRFGSYSDDASSVTTKRDINPQTQEETVMEFHFRDKKNRGTNYRTMSSKIIKEPKINKDIPFSIDTILTRDDIARVTQMSTMMGVVGKTFKLSVEDDDLIVTFGGNNGATHSSSVELKEGCGGRVRPTTVFSAPSFIKITKQLGRDDIRVRVNDAIIEFSQTIEGQTFKYYLRGEKANG